MKNLLRVITLVFLGVCLLAFLIAQETSTATTSAPETPAPAKEKKHKASKAEVKEYAEKVAKTPKKGRPLKNLTKQSDGHWSPYVAPALPENATQHSVKQGDTLWGISSQYLQDPYLWPQVWEKNTYIKNPHWIYPGDNVLIEEPKLVDKPKELDQPEETKAAISRLSILKPDPEKPAISFVPREVDSYYFGDVDSYCSGRLSSTPISFDAFIVGAEKENVRRYFGNGDLVFVNKGLKQNVTPGTRYQILRSVGSVYHPKTNHFYAYHYQEPGVLKVIIARDDYSVAQLEIIGQPVYIGDGLVPFHEVPRVKRDKEHRLDRFAEDNGKPAGNILLVNNKKAIAGTGEVVYVDFGKDKVTAGQRCSIFRIEGKFAERTEFNSTAPYPHYKGGMNHEFKAKRGEALANRPLPRVVIGELVIVDVYDNSAKAIIAAATESIELGGSVQLQ